MGLAEALNLSPIVKHVQLRAPWRQLTPFFRLGGLRQFAPSSDALAEPWPKLFIATGRHSVAASLLIKRLSGGYTRTVQIQNPVIGARHFDLVVVPRHDRLRGPNVIATRGALHRVTPEVLWEGAKRLLPRIRQLARPYVAVLLGGSNAAYRLEESEMTALATQLASCARAMSASLLITPSRRTGEKNLSILKEKLAGTPYFIWEGEGENPYFGMLGLADFIVPTSDSVNMISEAASTGKPVYVAQLPGGSRKFDRFHRMMRDEGLVREFEGGLAPYEYTPLDDVRTVVARVKSLLSGSSAPC